MNVDCHHHVFATGGRSTAAARILVLVAIGSWVGACRADLGGIATMSAIELAARMKADTAVVPVDANLTATRRRYGVIPGAVLLPDGSSYDAAVELPAHKDRTLVFYCTRARCSAAPSAARRARDAGFRDVYVMPEGITGWIAAGMSVVAMPAG